MIIRLNHADEPDPTGRTRVELGVPVDALQRPLTPTDASSKSTQPAWLGSIAPAQRYQQAPLGQLQQGGARSLAPEVSLAPAIVDDLATVLAPSNTEGVPLSELERTQVVTETLSNPYRVQFNQGQTEFNQPETNCEQPETSYAQPEINCAQPELNHSGLNQPRIYQRQPGLRPIVMPPCEDDPWAAPRTAVALSRTGTMDDALSALLQAPIIALKDKVSKAATIVQDAASLAHGAATIVGAQVGTKVASVGAKVAQVGTKVASVGAKVASEAVASETVAVEPALLAQQVKAKALGLGQGSHAIVEAEVTQAPTKRVGLLQGFIQRRLNVTAALTSKALCDASSALSGIMSMEQIVPLSQLEPASSATTSVLTPYDVEPKLMDDDLTYDQWIKQQGVPFAALDTAPLSETGCSSVSSTPVLHAVSWKNELNSKSLEPWGTVPQERLTQRLNSYFLHSEHFSESFKQADHQHQVAAILGYGIFRQWLQRRRTAQHELHGMIAQSQESLFYYTALLLIETMIFAMRVDGRIEQDEHDSLLEFCAAIFNDKLYKIRGELDRMLTIDLDPELLAQRVQFPEESIDMYLLSAVLLAGNCMLERNYLEALAACLGIDPTLRRSLDRRAHELIVGQTGSAASRNAAMKHKESAAH